MKTVPCILVVLTFGLTLSCAKPTDPSPSLSSDKAITAFSFASPAATGVITESAKIIALTVPSGTAVTALVATFTSSAGASVKVGTTPQVSGTTPNDFTSPVTYVVTAADGTKASYAVTVIASDKAILSFAFLAADNPGLAADASGTVTEDKKLVYVPLPAGTSPFGLKPRIRLSPGATISPASLGATDFTRAIIYTVTAIDGSTQAYAVAAVVLPTAPEMLQNGDFTYDFAYGGTSYAAAWYTLMRDGAASTIDFSKAFVLSGSPRGTDEWAICLVQNGLILAKYGIYQLQFDGFSTNSADSIGADLMEEGVDRNADGNAYSTWAFADFSLGTTTKTYSTTLVMPNYDDPTGKIELRFGGTRTSGTVTVDNVSLKRIGTFTPPVAPEMVWNGDFALGSRFWSTWSDITKGATAVADFLGGAFTLTGTGRGIDDWDWQLISASKDLHRGQAYRVSFDASSTINADSLRAVVQENGTDTNKDGDAYTTWGEHRFSIGPQVKNYSFTFIMNSPNNDPEGDLVFCLGAAKGTIFIDNVSLQPVGGVVPILTWKNVTAIGGLDSNGFAFYGGFAFSGSSIYAGTSSGLAYSFDGGNTWLGSSEANGLACMNTHGVTVSGSKLYVSTNNGLSVSDKDTISWTNFHQADGLGGDDIRGLVDMGTGLVAATGVGLFVSTDGIHWSTMSGSPGADGIALSGMTLYLASVGVSISTDGGAHWVTKTMADGLGSNYVLGIAAAGSTICAATDNGLAISKNGGTTWTNRTTSDGLAGNYVFGTAISGLLIYAATDNGLSVSSDGGVTWLNYTAANGLADNHVYCVGVSGSTVYVGTGNGLSISQ